MEVDLPPYLSCGACRFLDYQHCLRKKDNLLPLEPLILQVNDIAKLKYSTFPAGLNLQYGVQLPYYVYRFILSDGSYLAPAKMFIERAFDEETTAEIDRIEQLIKTKELEVGCVVKVWPRRQHHERGIMCLDYIKVVYPKIDTIRCHGETGLTYIHCSVTHFSPHRRHDCTLAVDEVPYDPVPHEIVLFARICQGIFGDCVIAGGSCLEKDIDLFQGCAKCYSLGMKELVVNKRSSDVDIWIPFSPKRHIRFRNNSIQDDDSSAGTPSLRNPPEYSAIADPDDVFRVLYEAFRISHTPVTKKENYRTHKYSAEYGWVDMFVGLIRVYEFKLIREDGKTIERPVQLILIDALPERRNQPWHETVTSKFDIDIIQNHVIIDDGAVSKTCPGPRVGAVGYLNPSVNPLRDRTFTYTLRPCQTPDMLFKRIVKYRQRGFKLASLAFDPRCTEEWKNHVCDILRIVWAEKWIANWCKDTRQHLFAHLRKHILDFVVEGNRLIYPNDEDGEHDANTDLPLPRDQKVRNILERRRMMRKMILAQLSANHGKAPSGHQVNLDIIKRDWKIADEALREGLTVQEYLEEHDITVYIDSDSDDISI